MAITQLAVRDLLLQTGLGIHRREHLMARDWMGRLNLDCTTREKTCENISQYFYSMFFKCICELTFIKWDSDKCLNIHFCSANKYHHRDWLTTSETLCLSLLSLWSRSGLWARLSSPHYGNYLPFPMALATAVCSKKRDAEKDGNLEKKPTKTNQPQHKQCTQRFPISST